jgi:hypothetical protein
LLSSLAQKSAVGGGRKLLALKLHTSPATAPEKVRYGANLKHPLRRPQEEGEAAQLASFPSV